LEYCSIWCDLILTRQVLVIEYWNLRFIWNLVLGICFL